MNDGDELLVAFRMDDLEAGNRLRTALGLPREGHDMRELTVALALVERPAGAERHDRGWRQIFGASAFVWRYPERLTIRMMGRSGDLYSVTAADVDAAAQVEEHLAPFAGLVLDPPMDSVLCVCPKHYPDIWDVRDTVTREPT